MEITDLKHRVGRHFFDLVDEDANPLVVALALQDNSSVGLQHYSGEFEALHAELREMLRSRVEYSYQGFNESVGVYRQVVNSLKLGHEELHNTKQVLQEMQEELTKRKPVLRELQQKSMLYKQKLDILNDLEFLQQIPQQFEACIAQKQFNQAKMLLGQSLETVTIRDLTNQPSIKPLLSYIQTQQSQLVSKIVGEIRAHVYLTSPYAQRRLHQSAQNGASLADFAEENEDEDSISLERTRRSGLIDSDFVEFVKALPTLPEIEPDSNPESNSFAYLTSLIKTLADLQSLDSSLDSLLRRIPHDLNLIIHSVTREVIKDLRISPESVNLDMSASTLLEQFRSIDQTAVATLAKMVLLRFTRFLEAQFAITEIARQCDVNYDFDLVCEKVASAVRSFALTYIGSASGGSGAKGRNAKQANQNTSGSTKRGGGRKKEPIFKFGPTDENSRSLRDFETLRETLKRSVPGLLADDPNHLFADTHREEQLEVIAPAHILNIRPLLGPLTMFFAGARSIAKSQASKELFNNFLDQFLQESFVPRLKEAFDEAIAEIAHEEDAFKEMPNWRSKSQIPIVNCASQFSETLCLLCLLLDTGTTYREEYASILVGLLSRIAQYFQMHLVNMFKAGISVTSGASQRGGYASYNNNYEASANSLNKSGGNGGGYGGYLGYNSSQQKLMKVWEFAVHPPLYDLLHEIHEGNVNNMSQEFSIYFSKRYIPGQPKPTFTLADLIAIPLFKQITLLITSIHWLVLRLKQLRRVSTNGDGANPGSNNIPSRVRRRWTLLDTSNAISLNAKDTNDYAAHLLNATAILAGENLKNFDGIVDSLQTHALYALYTLRVDIFMSTVCHFDQMIVNRDFNSSNRGEEHDTVVDRMQQSLSLASEILDKYLLNTDRKFVFSGLPQFMNELFILETVNISEINEAGQNQLLTNVFALQQMLTSIVEDPRQVDFSRASGFLELLRLNPSLIIDKAREGDTDLGINDLKLLLEIRHRNAGPNTHISGSLESHTAQLTAIFEKQQTLETQPPNNASGQNSSGQNSSGQNSSGQNISRPNTPGITRTSTPASMSSSRTRTPPASASSSTLEQRRRSRADSQIEINAVPASNVATASTSTQSVAPKSSVSATSPRNIASASSRMNTQHTSPLKLRPSGSRNESPVDDASISLQMKRHEEQNTAQAERLRRERDELKRRSYEQETRVFEFREDLKRTQTVAGETRVVRETERYRLSQEQMRQKKIQEDEEFERYSRELEEREAARQRLMARSRQNSHKFE